MTSPLADVQLHLISSIDDLLAMREWAGQQRDVPVAFDTESEGLVPQRDRLRLAQLGDLRHGWAAPFEWCGAIIELIRDMIRRRQSIVAHNSGFDHRFIERWLGYSIPWHLVHDTMTIAALADPTRPKGLKPLAARLIDRNATAGQHLLDEGMKKNGWTWATVPADFPPYWSYAALDPVLTCHIWASLAPGVIETAPEAYDLERSVTPLLSAMMDAGLLVDRPYTLGKIEELGKYSRAARRWLEDTHGVTGLMSARQIHAAFTRLGMVMTGTTPTGLPSITKELLAAIAAAPPGEVSAASRDLAVTVLKARHAEKITGTYLENFLEMSQADGAVHCSIRQLEARTGRMCLAKGTMIDGPRDLVKYPTGVPVEDVRAGDWVYSFGNDGNVKPQRVKKVHDNGILPVIRLVYRRAGFHGGELMELKATPDHRIALRTGEYRELRDLKPGDKLGFMTRSVFGENGVFRSMIEWNGGKRVHEPRVICQPTAQEVVHHKNELTLDQRPSNLQPLTIKHHTQEHALMKMREFTAEELSELSDSDSNYGRIASKLGVGKGALILRCRELSIPVRTHQENIKKHWQQECPLSPTEFWRRLEELGGTGNGTGGGSKLARELGVSYNLIRKWKKEFSEHNHEVVAVIDDGESLPVYDLEMDGEPNFIAGELWVHNSCAEPNLQNLPRDDKIVRGCFIPRPGYVFISCDFSQIEMRIAAALSGDMGLIAAFAESDSGGRDFYSGLASELFSEEVEKEDPRRQAIKSMSYASLYGAGLAKQALTAGVTVAQLKPIRDAFNARYPGLITLTNLIQHEANEGLQATGVPFVRTSTGRYLPCDRSKMYALLNYKIQAEAGECLKRGIASLAAAGLASAMRVPVHDEVIFEVPARDAEELKQLAMSAMADTERYAVPITCAAKIMPERWVKG
jgi:DNA polymerase I-like protein with 3'-5' exonuclease and polymerase domains